MSKAKTHLLLIDQDPTARKDTGQLLAGEVVCSEASSCRDGLDALSIERPDCVIVSESLLSGDPSPLMTELSEEGIPVLILAAGQDEGQASDALRLGAQDCVFKERLSAESLRRAIRYAIENRRSEQRVRRAEQRYRNLFEEAPVMYVIAKIQNNRPVIVDCNNVFPRTLGYRREEVLGRALLDFFDPGWLETTDSGHERELLQPHLLPEECELAGRDGWTIHALLRAVPETDADGHALGVRAMLVDITERKQAEKALEESEAKTRALVDALPDVLMRIERRDDQYVLEPARDPSRFLDLSERPIESSHRELTGEVAKQFRRYFELALWSHGPTTFEYKLEVDGRARDLEARLVAASNNEVLAIIRDLSSQKELERQLRQSQRLEAVGRLAGGVAHDFNNILTVISGNAELALTDLPQGDDNAEAFHEVLDAAKRAADLTRQLLAFSRQQVMQPRPLDLNSLVSGLERMLRRVIGEDIRLSTQLDEIGTIKADPGQIEQILMNLAVNARDAMPEGGDLVFETQNVDFHHTYAGAELKIPSGRYVRLTVSDTGEGMDEDTLAHIFEPFFTTKAKGKGTGLGLSTVYGIVKQSGGYIWVYSEPGEGTIFKIYFPQEEAALVEEVTAPQTIATGGDETVLLVEDDAQVLAFARSVLEREGYSVLVARDGDEALTAAGSHHGPIDLVATDVVMPGMSGKELVENLGKSHDGVKVLYLSGYTDDAMGRRGWIEATTHFLEKPYTRDPLLRAVRRALDAPDNRPQ